MVWSVEHVAHGGHLARPLLRVAASLVAASPSATVATAASVSSMAATTATARLVAARSAAFSFTTPRRGRILVAQSRVERPGADEDVRRDRGCRSLCRHTGDHETASRDGEDDEERHDDCGRQGPRDTTG